ncbi:MAG: universal stress protein [Halobacteriales archaeon]
MYDTILVPTDGSEGAETAAGHALQFAVAFGADVHLLSVVDDRVYTEEPVGVDELVQQHREALEADANDAVADLASLASDAGIEAKVAVEHGVPHATIRDYVDAHDVDLVSMGTHGRTGLERYLVGSVTERIVRTSDVPVLTSRLGDTGGSGYDDVLLPTDGSDPADAAREHALAIAEAFDATLHVLSVVDVRALASNYDAGGGTAQVLDMLRDAGRSAVDDAAAAAEDRGVEATTAVTEGTPYRSIKNYVDAQDVDVIAMGTHGRTGLERYLIGSVTERVVRTSDVPVVTVR